MRTAPEGFELTLPDGSKVSSAHDLIAALERMTDDDFAHLVTAEKNVIADWIARTLDEKFLAERLRRETTREGVRKELFIAAFR